MKTAGICRWAMKVARSWTSAVPASAAVLMPYGPFLSEALACKYDFDHLATRFGVALHPYLGYVVDPDRNDRVVQKAFENHVIYCYGRHRRLRATPLSRAEDLREGRPRM